MSPSKRLYVAIGRRSRLEDRAARAQLKLLRAFRREVLGELSDAAAPGRTLRLSQMLSAVDRAILRGSQAAQAAASSATNKALAIGGGEDIYGLSPDLLGAVTSISTDAVRGVWGELGSKVKLGIRRVTLGLDNPYDAIAAVARLLGDESVLSASFAKAEGLMRTEVNRTFSVATSERTRAADARLGAAGQRILKYWLNANDRRVRDSHVLAGEEYTYSRAIPVDQPFMLATPSGKREALMFPLDPRASAANTANCRCVQGSRVVSVKDFSKLFPKAA